MEKTRALLHLCSDVSSTEMPGDLETVIWGRGSNQSHLWESYTASLEGQQ